MVIEYIGTIIRNEVANRKEKLYESQNRGVYMFRMDNDHVIDATLTGGPARYINHSCAPNCVAEVVTFERGHKIIISSNRRIQKGEEVRVWIVSASCFDRSARPVVFPSLYCWRNSPWGGGSPPSHFTQGQTASPLLKAAQKCPMPAPPRSLVHPELLPPPRPPLVFPCHPIGHSWAVSFSKILLVIELMFETTGLWPSVSRDTWLT
uniref:SET domain-containing protein n=1 Tax=Suricata suricatta TaxID=37032 RepID=A0A673TWQ2_SURSU